MGMFSKIGFLKNWVTVHIDEALSGRSPIQNIAKNHDLGPKYPILKKNILELLPKTSPIESVKYVRYSEMTRATQCPNRNSFFFNVSYACSFFNFYENDT